MRLKAFGSTLFSSYYTLQLDVTEGRGKIVHTSYNTMVRQGLDFSVQTSLVDSASKALDFKFFSGLKSEGGYQRFQINYLRVSVLVTTTSTDILGLRVDRDSFIL